VDGFPRNVIAVSADSQRPALVEGLLFDTDGFDVFIIESLSRAYSRIRALTPDLVIVFMEIDDAASCQLLSMLMVDEATAAIPVITCTIE
jgi:hypothetical protein